jgi:tRNA pseudouridine55 synthase
LDGVLLIDKPAGMSSHGVVAAVRRALRTPTRGPRTRVGHAGTLDPFATGLLLVLVGRATRLQPMLMALPKRYETVAQLGAVSTTMDPEGEITETGRVPPDPPVLPTGEIRQRPPRYSAVKINGERAYALARRGEVFETAERTVTVYRFEQSWREAQRAAFTIECSAGTYVRTLIDELGDAYCLQLRRTDIGPFSVRDAIAPPAPGDAAALEPIALDRALAFMPRALLHGESARVAAHGVAVDQRELAVLAPTVSRHPGGGAPLGDDPDLAEQVLLLDDHGALAIAQRREGPDGIAYKPVVGFRA